MPKPKQSPRTKAGTCVDQADGPQSTKESTKSAAEFNTEADILANTSTAKEIQVAKLLALLRQGPKTTIELRKHGIMMPAARVFDLKRDHGCTVETQLLALYDDQGVRHHKCARYHLAEQLLAQAAFDFEVPA